MFLKILMIFINIKLAAYFFFNRHFIKFFVFSANRFFYSFLNRDLINNKIEGLPEGIFQNLSDLLNL